MQTIEQLKEKQKLELERLKAVLMAEDVFMKGKQKADLKLSETMVKAQATFDNSASLAKTAHQKTLELLKAERSKVK